MSNLDTKDSSNLIEVVSLQTNDHSFCIPITSVREIRRWHTATALPNSDPATLGVINLRGAVIPIIDLAVRLGMAQSKVSDRSVVVVIAIGDKIAGLLVDVVSEILTIDESKVQVNPAQELEEGGRQITGFYNLGDQMLKVLNIDVLMNHSSEVAA